MSFGFGTFFFSACFFRASAAVVAAKAYKSYLGVKIKRLSSSVQNVSANIPQFPGPAVVNSIFLTNASNVLCEHVRVVFSSSHPFSSELEIVLTSPRGTKSVLANLHAITTVPKVRIESPPPLASKTKEKKNFFF
jgi:hypothetical protein